MILALMPGSGGPYPVASYVCAYAAAVWLEDVQPTIRQSVQVEVQELPRTSGQESVFAENGNGVDEKDDDVEEIPDDPERHGRRVQGAQYALGSPRGRGGDGRHRSFAV